MGKYTMKEVSSGGLIEMKKRTPIESENKLEQNLGAQKLEQELADKERILKVFERKATLEQRKENLEGRREEIEAIRAKIEQKKESSKEQGEKGMKRVEKSGGEPEDVEDAKNAADDLNAKTEEAAGEAEMSATDLFEQAQAMEAEQKVVKPAEGELRSTVDIVMDKYKVEKPIKKMGWGSPGTGFYVDDRRYFTFSDLEGHEQEAGIENPKDEIIVEEQKENILGITEKRVEARRLQGELDGARKAVALTEKNDPKYAEAMKGYQAKKEAMQRVAYEAKKATLLKKGISEADAEIELGKYAREVLVPNFAVAEAAKIQDAKAEETMLEKVKDLKALHFIYGAVGKYRKMSWQKKLLVSGGLFGGALVAGAAGGAVGAVIGGGVGMIKVGQRLLGGAGAVVGTEAMIQRSQQKWMDKEGWGKNRKEYVANEIQKLREGVKKGEVSAESLEEEGGMKEVEGALEERKKLEEKFEKSRTIIAGIVGFVFGSGAVTQAVKNVGEWTGVTNLIFGGHKEISVGEKAKEFAGAAKEQVKATVAPVQEKIIPIAVGVRGPEGALIDNFNAHPDLAKTFGWDGKSNLSQWAGSEAHKLWNADAKEALKNPQILAQMEKLGFSKDADGYAKMAHRIGKGFIQIDPADKHIKFTDMEYLKNTTKELKNALGVGVGPQAGVAEYQSLSDLAKATEGAAGAEVQAPLQGAQKILHDLVNQKALSEWEKKMDPHIKELADRLKENGLSPEEVMKYSDDISENAAKLAGIDLSTAKGMINIEALQQIMESSEGKLGVLLSKLPEIDQDAFKSYVEKTGGWEKFMDMPSTELFPEDGARASVTGFTKLGEVLKGLTGDASILHGTATVREVLGSINSKEIFGDTAEELMEKIK